MSGSIRAVWKPTAGCTHGCSFRVRAPVRVMRVNDELSTRTFGNDDRLPRVPLPTLAETCQRFLVWCAPLLTAEQLAATVAEVDAFQRPDGAGARLHAA